MSARVLIVEDDPATRNGLTELVANAGYETRALATFEEGLRALRTDTPDLLIADVRLGAYNGLQLLVTWLNGTTTRNRTRRLRGLVHLVLCSATYQLN